MEEVYSALTKQQNFMAHAPTGSGKTDSALSAAISFALENKKDVFFLTPKISQHKIAVEVVRDIGAMYALPLRAVDIIGRRHLCIDDEISGLGDDGFYYICETKRKKSKCPFYNNIHGKGLGGKENAENDFLEIIEGYGYGKTYNEIIEVAREKKFCPYELVLKVSTSSNIIIGDYYHLLVPPIRESLFGKTGKRINDSIVIIDEAHNLASRVRGYLSSSINTLVMRMVERELRFAGFKPPAIEEKFGVWAEELLDGNEEKRIEKEDFYNLLFEFDADFFSALEEAGLAFITTHTKRSAALKLLRFINLWDDSFESVRILKKDKFGFSLSKRMLDPSVLTGVLNETHSSILMSGTLLPLEMHRDILGLDKGRTIMKAYPSPFSKDSILNLICTGVTTRYSERTEENYAKIAGKINAVAESTPGGVAVFFPSYKVMDGIVPFIKAERMYAQAPNMKPREVRGLLDSFTKNGGMLCGVQGGSLAEGIDYCKGELKTIIIVGVALDEMNLETEALIDYYEKKFGKGWEYGYLYPGTIKALQAAGRGRRKETDRVVVVYMDERFKWKRYNWIFDRNEKIIITSKPDVHVARFWSKHTS